MHMNKSLMLAVALLTLLPTAAIANPAHDRLIALSDAKRNAVLTRFKEKEIRVRVDFPFGSLVGHGGPDLEGGLTLTSPRIIPVDK